MSEFVCIWDLPPIASEENIKMYIESFCETKKIIKLNSTSALVEFHDEELANDAAVTLDNLEVIDSCVQAAVIAENSAELIRLNIDDIDYLKGLRLNGQPFYESDDYPSSTDENTYTENKNIDDYNELPPSDSYNVNEVPSTDKYYYEHHTGEISSTESYQYNFTENEFYDRLNIDNTQLIENIQLSDESNNSSNNPGVIEVNTNSQSNRNDNINQQNVGTNSSWYASDSFEFVGPQVNNTSLETNYLSEPDIEDIYDDLAEVPSTYVGEYEPVSSVESNSSEEVLNQHTSCSFPSCRNSCDVDKDQNNQITIFSSQQTSYKENSSCKNAKQKTNVLDSNKCPVCLSTYSEIISNKMHLVSTHCGHVFCCKCADNVWSKKKPNCPVCRVKLVPFYPLQLSEDLNLEAKVQQLYLN